MPSTPAHTAPSTAPSTANRIGHAGTTSHHLPDLTGLDLDDDLDFGTDDPVMAEIDAQLEGMSADGFADDDFDDLTLADDDEDLTGSEMLSLVM